MQNQATTRLQRQSGGLGKSVHGDLEVGGHPEAPVIRDSLEIARPEAGAGLPQPGAWRRLQCEYHPATWLDPETTGQDADDLINAVLAGEELL